MKVTKWLAAVCVVLGAGISEAQAQIVPWEDKGYLALNFGVQPQSRVFTELSTPLIYGENASLTVPHTVSSGAFFDIAAGWRIWQNLAVGVGYSSFSDSESPTLAAQIPNPALTNSLRTASASTGDLEHSESAVHLHLLYMIPLTEKVEAAIVVGPSFYTIKQDFVASVALQEGLVYPFGSVTISSVERVTQSKKATAFTAGVDGTYLITPRYGVGGFFRFSGASVDLPITGGGTVTVNAGGLQLGGGLRVRF
jgi:hypothetical protein